MTDLAALRQAAEAATAGPWRVEDETWIDAGDYDSVIAPATPECMAYCYGGSSRIEITAEDAAFIATANPTAVLVLLDEVEALRAKVARVEALAAECDTPCSWPGRCADSRHLRADPRRAGHPMTAAHSKLGSDAFEAVILAERAWRASA